MTDVAEHIERPLPFLERAPLRLVVTVEMALYLVVAALALVTRLAGLGTIALSNAEAREALAAWHAAFPQAAGTAPLAGSPLQFTLNTVVMALLGGSELTARLATALGGVGLVLLPLLFRPVLGRVAALLTSGLLLISTATLVAARTMSPAVWSLLLAGIGLWLVWRFVEGDRPAAATLAAVLFAAVALLADPAGFVLLAILLVAWAIALRLSADEAPAEQPAPRLQQALARWSWRDSLLAIGATIIVVGTAFFLYPGGLAQVGELLERGIGGLFLRPAGYPFAFPLLAGLLYEPLVWLLGALGVAQTLAEGDFAGRFLVGWLAGGLVAALLYAGAGPAYALWLVIPLAALGGRALARTLAPAHEAYWPAPRWALAVLSLGLLALLFVASTNLVFVALAVLSLGLLALLFVASTNLVFVARALTGVAIGVGAGVSVPPLRLMLAGMAVLLLVILYFLGGSLWGPRVAHRGLVLALTAFLAVYGLSCAWRVAVTHAGDPRELWHVQPVDPELTLLRETLSQVSERHTGRPDEVAIVAALPDDSAVAWQMRDFRYVRYIPVVDRRETDPVIVTTASFQPEALGARYVGQDFVVTRTWDMNRLRWEDALVWLMYGEAQAPPQVDQKVVVWVREDVYGLPPASQSSGEEPAG